MSHENITPSYGSYDDDMFDEIVSQEWSPMEHRIDAGVRSLLDRARELERAFNDSGDASSEPLLAELDSLNRAWDKLGYWLETLRFTGRLRAISNIEEDEIRPIIEANSGLYPPRQDYDGQYYPARGYECCVIGFGLETVETLPGLPPYRVCFELSLDGDEADTAPGFTLNIDDVRYIEVPHPTTEGAQELLWQNHPNLMQYICDTLPDNCGDDTVIIGALSDFCATLDIDDHMTDLSREQIIDYIEQYITDRLGFDDSLQYNISAEGLVYGVDARQNRIPRNMRGQTVCRVERVRMLVDDDDTQDADKTYRLYLEIKIPLTGRGSGWTTLIVPMSTVQDFYCDRPTPENFVLMDEEDAIVLDPDEIMPEYETEPSTSATALGEMAVEAAAIDYAETGGVMPETREQKIDRYRMMRDKFFAVHARIIEATSRTFDTREDALAYEPIITGMMRELHEVYPAHEAPTLLVSGEAIFTTDTTMEVQSTDTESIIKLNSKNVVIGDMTTQKRAVVINDAVFLVRKNDKYSVGAFIYLVDLAREGSIRVIDPTQQHSLFELSATRRLTIDMSNPDLGFNYELLERADARREAFERLRRSTIDEVHKERLRLSLEAFAEGFDAEIHPTETIDVKNLDRLRSASALATGDLEQSDIIAETLSSILDPHRPMFLSGPAIDSGGSTVELYDTRIKIVTAISQHPNLSTPEPSLLVETFSPDQNESLGFTCPAIVPISTLTNMKQ